MHVCGMDGTEEKCTWDFGEKTLKKEAALKIWA
jgi:hypothetical protein